MMRQIKATLAGAGLAALVLQAGSAQAERFPLATEGNAAFYSVPLDAGLYIHSVRPGLADLRVRNGAGELVPYTLETPPAQATEMRAVHDVPWFLLPDAPTRSDEGTVGVTIGPDGALKAVNRPTPTDTVGVWVLDLSQLRQSVTGIVVGLSAEDFQSAVDVQASNDLQSWRAVGRAQLLRLSRDGTVLSQNRIELGRSNARYLRLVWQGKPPVPSKIQAETVASGAKAPIVLQWRENIPSSLASDGSYLFDAGGQFPAERIRLRLPQANTVAQAVLWSRTNEQAAWRQVSQLRLYRLVGPDGEQQNEPIAIPPNGDRLWKLTVDSRTGGLGGGTPVMALGWQPAVMTFVARGAAPFTLTVAEPDNGPAGLARDELLVGTAPTIGTARITGMTASPPSPAPPAVTDTGQTRRLVLWGVLLAAVVVLALMAWKLLRAMGANPPSNKP